MLFRRGEQGFFASKSSDAAILYYAEPNASRSSVGGWFEPEGTVDAGMCTQRNRIFLHGIPN